MIEPTGPVIYDSAVAPETIVRSIPPHLRPLALVAGGPAGWFGGRTCVCWSPGAWIESTTLAGAGVHLEAAYAAGEPVLAAALIRYDARASVAVYSGGLVLEAKGWCAWGHAAALGPRELADIAPPAAPADALVREYRSSADMHGFVRGVETVRDAVESGAVYVLNLTYAIEGERVSDAAGTFRTLCARADAEMAALFVTPELALASASPERFLSISGDRARGRHAEIWPIKGTRPRGIDSAEDGLLMADLESDEKERAEHVMVVDMIRNDLGRVSVPGTVGVEPLGRARTTAYCHHLVSRVRCRLRDDATIGEVLEATFPCGSVTGAPKIAAMRIAASLESEERGVYTGSLVVAVPGRLDSSVLIRTAELRGSRLRWGTGGGITHDSDPVAEWLETRLKAAPMLGDTTPPLALKETCRAVRGRVPLLGRHLARLAAGGCGPTALGEARAAVASALDAAGAAVAYARLGLVVDTEGRASVTSSQQASSLDVPGGPAIAFVSTPVPPLPTGAAKPADRSVWDAAQARARELGADQALLVGPDGLLIDGATASVWIRRNDRLLTPPAPPAVAGVMRGLILDNVHRLGYVAEECPLAREDIETAEEVFLSNAVFGVAPARGRGGAACEALGRFIGRVFEGEPLDR